MLRRSTRLIRRADFARAMAGRRIFGSPRVVAFACVSGHPVGNPAEPGSVRVGVAAARRVRGAVLKNRVRRRLRAAAHRALQQGGDLGRRFDLVLVGTSGAVRAPFSEIVDDVRTAFRRAATSGGLQATSDWEQSSR